MCLCFLWNVDDVRWSDKLFRITGAAYPASAVMNVGWHVKMSTGGEMCCNWNAVRGNVQSRERGLVSAIMRSRAFARRRSNWRIQCPLSNFHEHCSVLWVEIRVLEAWVCCNSYYIYMNIYSYKSCIGRNDEHCIGGVKRGGREIRETTDLAENNCDWLMSNVWLKAVLAKKSTDWF